MVSNHFLILTYQMFEKMIPNLKSMFFQLGEEKMQIIEKMLGRFRKYVCVCGSLEFLFRAF